MPRHHHHHRHHPGAAGFVAGAVVGGAMMAAMAPPPRRGVTVINTAPGYLPVAGYGYHPPPPVVIVGGGGRRYGARQEVVAVNQHQHRGPPPEEPFNVTDLSVADVQERGSGVWYYKVLVSTEDSNWEVWRRYNQFDELRSSVDKYISCYAKFPSKQGLFSSLVGQKLNDQELIVRQHALDSWLREVLTKAMSSPRQRLRDILKVFLEWRSRKLIAQGMTNSGVAMRVGSNAQGGSGMMTIANMNGSAMLPPPATMAAAPAAYAPQAHAAPPIYAGEAEVVAHVPKETSAPPFNPNQINDGKDGNAPPIFVPTAEATAPPGY